MNQYVQGLSTILASHANKINAGIMKRYMKNLFPFLGIKAPERKIIFSKFIRENGLPSKIELSETVRILYSRPEREFHYFAMELVNRYAHKIDITEIKLFEFMIVTNSWWDTVDFIASNILGNYFNLYPEMIRLVLTKWIDSGNIWLQRSCILFQLKYKKDTDLDLLYSFIKELKDSNEFFIQKAIGWILREYSKVNPEEVQRYVSENQLKKLSKREAMKIIIRKKIKVI